MPGIIESVLTVIHKCNQLNGKSDELMDKIGNGIFYSCKILF